MNRPGRVPGEEGRARMTLRVSRDSGRTWGPSTVVRDGDRVVVMDNPLKFPACTCARCCGARRARPARSQLLRAARESR
ncbi:exo-alpha-sialidase [Streptomyces sp. NPDC057638]|uniref:exo-alpha-sialidase n=1 Tax=Streptomyces sp. NPDC057638 TaxID=3346190 RepID=UPI00369F3010